MIKKKKKFKTKPKQNKCCQPLSSTLANVTTGGGGAHRARSSSELTLRANARGVADAEALATASPGRKRREGGRRGEARRPAVAMPAAASVGGSPADL